MLDIKFIRENAGLVQEAAKKKHIEFDVQKLLEVDDRRRVLLQLLEEKRAIQNAESARLGIINKTLEEKDRQEILARMSILKQEMKDVEEQLKLVIKDWYALMLSVPNIPSVDTPIGDDETGNKVIRQWGEKPNFDFEPRAHWDLGKELGIINSEKAAEVSGSRFSYIMGDLALLQFALLQFLFKILTKEETLQEIVKEFGLNVSTKPFIPVIPPIMMNSATMNKMARLQPLDERYYFEKDDMIFVGSAEHTLGPLHMNEILEEKDLPIRYIGYSVAMRREAGAHGKDNRGILRQHQFDKAEMETFTLPENSYTEQDFLVSIQEYILRKLNIPYQVVLICTGDMGKPDHRQVDIESWMPGQNSYRETHTADLMQGYQARRLNTRVNRTTGNIEHVHMNDATAIAMGRTMIAIIENYQNADGSITIPEVLRPYMGGQEKIEKK